jgi:hypothetical protein
MVGYRDNGRTGYCACEWQCEWNHSGRPLWLPIRPGVQPACGVTLPHEPLHTASRGCSPDERYGLFLDVDVPLGVHRSAGPRGAGRTVTRWPLRCFGGRLQRDAVDAHHPAGGATARIPRHDLGSAPAHSPDRPAATPLDGICPSGCRQAVCFDTRCPASHAIANPRAIADVRHGPPPRSWAAIPVCRGCRRGSSLRRPSRSPHRPSLGHLPPGPVLRSLLEPLSGSPSSAGRGLGTSRPLDTGVGVGFERKDACCPDRFGHFTGQWPRTLGKCLRVK